MTAVEKLGRFALLPVSLESELGRCSMPVREILSLAPGSVIKLDEPVGSKVRLYVGGAPFGSGEVVRAGDATAVRVTDFEVAQGG